MKAETSLLQLLRLLGQLDILAATRDREKLAETVVVAACDLMEARFALMHKIAVTPHGYVVLPLAWTVNGNTSSASGESIEIENSPISADPLLEACMSSDSGIMAENNDGDVRIAFTVGDPNSAIAIFEGRCNTLPSDEACNCVRHLLGIYAKHLHLLDYAELDTLTKLNNRKTFDEYFDHFIEMAEQSQRPAGQERRGEKQSSKAGRCWIGVVDIDRFKRINDNFGHLFGDEVLLRIAELMKKSFRSSDKLFRFGGEEFVVMLRNVSAENALMVLDRFRRAVEKHEFPQVGQVTCSLGYMEIEPNLTPAEILGQADKALYFSKENGRNQINCYASLVEKGLLEGAPNPAIDAKLQADIDALFD